MALLLSGEIRALQRAPLGALLMIGAAISWAIGLILIRKWAATRPATSYSAWQMLIGVVPIVALALFVEDGSFNPLVLPPGPMIGVFYNLFVAFIFCHWAWFRLMAILPATVAAIGTVGIPIVGLFASALVLGEPWPVLVFSSAAAVGVLVLHRGNLSRLRAGTETRVQLRRKPATTT